MPTKYPPHLSLFKWWMTGEVDPKVREFYAPKRRTKSPSPAPATAAPNPKANVGQKVKKSEKNTKEFSAANKLDNEKQASKTGSDKKVPAANAPIAVTNNGKFSAEDDKKLREWKDTHEGKPWTDCDAELRKPKGACKARWAELRMAKESQGEKEEGAAEGGEEKKANSKPIGKSDEQKKPSNNGNENSNGGKSQRKKPNAWSSASSHGHGDPLRSFNMMAKGMQSDIDTSYIQKQANHIRISEMQMQKPIQKSSKPGSHEPKNFKDPELYKLHEIVSADNRAIYHRVQSKYFDQTGIWVALEDIVNAMQQLWPQEV